MISDEYILLSVLMLMNILPFYMLYLIFKQNGRD